MQRKGIQSETWAWSFPGPFGRFFPSALKLAAVVFFTGLAGLTCLTGGVLHAAPPCAVIVLYDDSGREVFEFSPPDGRFTIRFIHSWARTPVEEIFQVDEENNIVLRETVYEDFGAGLPYELTPESQMSMTVENGKVHIRDMHRIVPDLQVRTGQLIAAHVLLYEDKSVSFSDFVKPGSVVVFRVKNVKN